MPEVLDHPFLQLDTSLIIPNFNTYFCLDHGANPPAQLLLPFISYVWGIYIERCVHFIYFSELSFRRKSNPSSHMNEKPGLFGQVNYWNYKNPQIHASRLMTTAVFPLDFRVFFSYFCDNRAE